ncbi:La1-like protein 13 [Frankliniella fusca]|uniref:La1-like protein 13 n=1 Tax=Frankliniella fusca TaxID=407009 RepID=A0AAE1LFX9_9NEOP|nr:La1-like protein 13 [Frankliniella fusca]
MVARWLRCNVRVSESKRPRFNSQRPQLQVYYTSTADQVQKTALELCAWLGAQEGCEIVPGDPTAVYPGCCPDLNCNANLLGVDGPREKGAGERSL